MLHAHDGPSAKKFTVCPWSGSLRLLGPDSGMEQVHRANTARRPSDSVPLLYGTMATFRQSNSLQGQIPDQTDEIVTAVKTYSDMST